MIRTKPSVRGLRAIFAAAAVVGCTGVAEAGVSFDAASTCKITHDPDVTNATVAAQTKNVNPPPLSGAMAVPSSYSYSKTIIQGTGSTSASASIGAISTASTLGYTFASGTGISQSDPNANAFGGDSSMKIAVDGTFDITSGGFGPTAYGYMAFTIGGVIPIGGSAAVHIDLRWTDAAKTVDYRTPISTTLSFNTATTSLVYPYSSTVKLGSGGSFTSGQVVRVSGTIDFRSNDPFAPVSIVPADFEMSAAPPTWTSTANNKPGTAIYGDPTAWTFANTDGTPSPALQAIPDEAGARARFVGAANDFILSVDQARTLGTLDIDQPLFSVASQASGVLTFDTLGGNAVVLVRNVHGDSPHNIGAPLTLATTLEVENDCQGPLTFASPIGGAGGIIKNGLGALILQPGAPSGYTGGTVINAGAVNVNSNGALGTGSAVVSGGLLNVNVPNPFAGSGLVQVVSNGQMTLGTATPGVQYNVADLGCISGGASQLTSLNAGVGGNLGLASGPGLGAMIGHAGFDTGVVNNPANLNSAPSYIFGISADFNSIGGGESMTVGNTSGTPWIGFGGDKLTRIFGSSPASSSQQLNISGQAQLVSLGSKLVMNAPINGLAADSISKRGAGLVAINSLNNNFLGVFNVDSGPVAVNGFWNASSNNVNGGVIGGTGTIVGNVVLDDAAVFSPGVLGTTATFADAPVTIEGPGTLHTGQITFTNLTHLRYNLNTPNVPGGGGDNDLLLVNGNITLDGILEILEQDDSNISQDVFGGGVFTLMTCTGLVTDHGLQLPSYDEFPNMQYSIISNPGGGQSVILSVPEPGSLAFVGLGLAGVLVRRRRAAV